MVKAERQEGSQVSRYVIDPDVALRLAVAGHQPEEHQLLAPVLLRSQVLDLLFRRARRGGMDEAEGRRLLQVFGRLKIRFLGDAVMRREAWDLAWRLEDEGTDLAEYAALTSLQGDAMITDDIRFTAYAETFGLLMLPAAELGI